MCVKCTIQFAMQHSQSTEWTTIQAIFFEQYCNSICSNNTLKCFHQSNRIYASLPLNFHYKTKPYHGSLNAKVLYSYCYTQNQSQESLSIFCLYSTLCKRNSILSLNIIHLTTDSSVFWIEWFFELKFWLLFIKKPENFD